MGSWSREGRPLAVADPDFEIKRGEGEGGRGGGSSPPKFFGLKIRGGWAPRAPPLDLPLLEIRRHIDHVNTHLWLRPNVALWEGWVGSFPESYYLWTTLPYKITDESFVIRMWRRRIWTWFKEGDIPFSSPDPLGFIYHCKKPWALETRMGDILTPELFSFAHKQL